jgi:hypothetical protein
MQALEEEGVQLRAVTAARAKLQAGVPPQRAAQQMARAKERRGIPPI